MECPKCHFENPPVAKFCMECGMAFEVACPQCGTKLPSQAKFCFACGTRVGEKSASVVEAQPTGTHPAPRAPEGERRQLTVMFCDLVGSTSLSGQLDPEDLHSVLRVYQEVCAKVIHRFEGYIAKYMGDGLLVYFGYPQAHEDDAQRAVRAGLGIVEVMERLTARLEQERGVHLAVRLGIHTGLVVVGEIGAEGQRAMDVVGETPNIAARLQEIAGPNMVVLGAATHRLLQGFFDCQELGTYTLKGVSQPMPVYRALHESTARSRLDAAVTRGALTPLVGRESEINLLLDRWKKAQRGQGQVALLESEPGLGKSRLVQTLKERVAAEPHGWLTELYCSSFHQNSSFHPFVDFLQRVVLQFERDESVEEKLGKVEGLLVQYGFSLPETVPLFASLLSLPLGEGYTPLSLSPERQRQKTLEALLTILKTRSEQQPVLLVVEDLHWIDPTTLEWLNMVVDHAPHMDVLAVLTFRPAFVPPWSDAPHVTHVNLDRLSQRETEEMVLRVSGGKPLPPDVLHQVVTKTDGVPLFVEELTKMVLESGLLEEREDRYVLNGPLPPLAIPTTLHDSLIARLDRLDAVKDVAQWGAVLGREFGYDLLSAVTRFDHATLRRSLEQLILTGLIYPQESARGQLSYRFKHALIQDAAYESLLKSRRQQYHQRIAFVLERQFSEIAEIQPELIAHHYTEAGLSEKAIPYWQKAGERAIARSAHLEAIGHLTRGLALLNSLPETSERHHHEIGLRICLGVSLTATKGYGVEEVGRTYSRARDLSQQTGDSAQRFRALYGLWRHHMLRAEYRTAREQGEELLRLAQSEQNPSFLVAAHRSLGATLFYMGEFSASCEHVTEVIESASGPEDDSLTLIQDIFDVVDPRVTSRSYFAWDLWMLGYPDRARRESEKAVGLSRQLNHPFSIALAVSFATWLHQFFRDVHRTRELAEEAVTLSAEQGFPFWTGWGHVLRGWTLAEQGQWAEAIPYIRKGLDEWQTQGSELGRSYFLTLLAEVYAKGGRVEDALNALAEAQAFADATGERFWEAERLRLKGELLARYGLSTNGDPEQCFLQAFDIARQQNAKSLELRAALSLSRLWQERGRSDEAQQILGAIYGWFNEGFDTSDFQESRTLMETLA